MTATLDHALAYLDLGWAVFPVHGIVDGRCTCRAGPACPRPGKHPRISNGRTGATHDPAVVRSWWHVWPDANIGIATGTESGLLVMDLDDPYAFDEADLPATVEALTGGGGRHLLFARPTDEARYLTLTNVIAQGVDSRADGGYIVAPPSMHVSGRRYEWESSSMPGDVPLAHAPEWWLEAIRRTGMASAPAPAWNPDGELPDNLQDMLEAIPADDYTMWRDVGLALNHTDPVDGLAWWDWWSSTSAKYNPVSVRQQWRAMTRRGHAVARPITIETVRRRAEEHGYTDPALEHGAEVAAALLESHQQSIVAHLASAPVEPDVVAPPSLVPICGLLGEMVEYILATSIRPLPELATAAAVAYVGTLAGRRFRTETDLRTNVYMVGIAESGAGKDHARKCVQRMAQASGTGEHLGGEQLASGPGIISALRRNPSMLFMLDEFGLMLAGMTSAHADQHKRQLMATLMSLYTSASVVYRGTEYADQKDRPRVEIIQPNACVYGTSTPAQFYAALTSMQGVDGSLARLLVVHAQDERPARQRPSDSAPPQTLVERIRDLVSMKAPGAGNLAGTGGGTVDTDEPYLVAMDPAVYDVWEALDDTVLDLASDSASKTIYSRVAENAARLALIYAVSRDHYHPRIDAEALAWGRELALWCANSLVLYVGRLVADNPVEAAHKRVANIIREAGPEGIPRNVLTRRCRFLRRREMDEVLSMLLQGGDYVAIVGGTKGRPVTTYHAVGT